MIEDDDLDRVLSTRAAPAPSDGFAASVMSAVAREAEGPLPLSFPWRRIALGLVAFALGIGVQVIAGPPADATAPAFRWLDIGTLLAGVDRVGLQRAWWIALALLVTCVIARLASWFAGRQLLRGPIAGRW